MGIEWYHSSGDQECEQVSDEEAGLWLMVTKAYGGQYRLFLKHWETAKLREGPMFVDDTQMFSSVDHMLAEFSHWGRYYYPVSVAFQIGYLADKKWWGDFPDPARTLGNAILDAIPHTRGLSWVDFTTFEVFPP